MGRRPFVRQRIIEAGFDLLGRRGYEAVSTREIAAAAEVGHASMYRHFASKEELGRELYRLAGAALEEEYREAMEGVDTALEERLGRIVRCFYGWYDRRPRALALLIFPPHDFTPPEVDPGNPRSLRRLVRRDLGLKVEHAALFWGALTGPLQDRYLHLRRGRMGPHAEAHTGILMKLLGGIRQEEG